MRKIGLMVVLSLVCVLMLYGLSFAVCANDPNDPGNCDTLFVTRVPHVPPDTQLTVTISLYSDEYLMGLTIPLTWYDSANTAIVCDTGWYSSWITSHNPSSTAPLRKSPNGQIYNDSVWCAVAGRYLKKVVHADVTWFVDSLPPSTGVKDIAYLQFTTGSSWESDIHVVIDTLLMCPPSTGVNLLLVTTMAEGFIPVYVIKGQLDVEDVRGAPVPTEFSLSQNYPNPFNPSTTIRFDLAKDDEVTLVIYNVLGQKVKTLVDHQNLPPGTKQVGWNGTDDNNKPVASGAYFYQITTKNDNNRFTKKMVLTK